MTRQHGRILTAIWADDDFLALDVPAQRMYLFLLSQPDLSHAGLLPMRTRRWAKKVAGETVGTIESALTALEAARFVVVDEDTEEVLLRTFVRNDGVWKQPKVMMRMREDAAQIESPRLREAFAVELARLPLDDLSKAPGGRGGDLPSPFEQVAAVVDALREDFRDAFPMGTGTPAEGSPVPPCVRAGALPLPPTPVPQPPTPVPPTAAAADASAQPESAQTLIGEWIDHCDDRPPGRVIGQLSREVKTLLTEGIPFEVVRAGLVEWHRKGLHPSALASVVHETRRGPRRLSPTDGVVDVLAMGAEMQAEHDRRQIGA
ncbi:hypothetical protein [Cellulomonas sp. C5510]|uniref:hypothetical protein n=1 Tax=Cellulomonas sp. C5510 TaxID=2871170 RepID=UPI001C96C7A6|nr:hypothetical protein [Cellulomonas sp. C5510]QZN86919.1 hypothetical protein K5O09_07355 [Cellulomonas sp. C5510]